MPIISNEFIIDKEKNKNFLDILTKKLFYFYNETNNYEPFKKINNSRYWDLIFEDIRVSIGSGKIRLLEVGSGRSGFASKLVEHNLRENVHYTAQDITYKNYDFLIENADEVFIGDVSKLSKKYDIIFSTFVLEHIVDPDRFLDILFNLLFENGREYIICPRYDFPFYLSPSIKHKSMFRRIFISFWLQYRKILNKICDDYSFIIHSDPAVFYKSFFRDSDAIHWVLQESIVNYHKKKFGTESIDIAKTLSANSIIDKFYKRNMLLYLKINKS